METEFVTDDGLEPPPLTEKEAGADGRWNSQATPVVQGESVPRRSAATHVDAGDRRLAEAGLAIRRRTGSTGTGRHVEVLAGGGARSEARPSSQGGVRTVPRSVQHMLRALSMDVAPRAPERAPIPTPRAGGSTGTAGERKLTTRSAAGEVVLAHVREQVQQIRAQELLVRQDAPDAVHKMRVASRRLRSALATFRPLLLDDVAGPIGGELKWLAGELGAARDAEVMRDRVLAAVEAQDPVPGTDSAAAMVDAELGSIYSAAHGRVLADLDDERYRVLLVALDGLVASPPLTDRAAGRAGKVLPRLVARSYTKVRRIVKRARKTTDPEEREELLHDARKAAKRARYAAESVSPVFGADADAFAEAMEAVQEALGEHQDSVLARERLRELARHTSSPDAAFLYGRLHAREEAAALRSQERFDSAWKAAGDKSLHRWLR